MYKYLLFLLPTLFFLACEDDDDTLSTQDVEMNVNFRAEYGERPLAIQSGVYDYPTGDRLKVLLFQYYVSGLELLPADGGDPVKLSDIELIRWMSASEDANATRTYRVPVGDYVGLRFGLGVSPDLNARDPSTFAADDVLNENEFWGPGTRYVFAKIEANADLENDGTYDTGLTYHMGSDALYTQVTFNSNFSVSPTEAPSLTIVSDVLKALSGSGETFDITDPTKRTVHGGNQDVAVGIWQRLAGQFLLEVND